MIKFLFTTNFGKPKPTLILGSPYSLHRALIHKMKLLLANGYLFQSPMKN